MSILNNITLHSLKTRNTRHGVAWSASLRLNGKLVCKLSHEGRGGDLMYDHFKYMTHSEWGALVKQIEDASDNISVEMLACCCVSGESLNVGLARYKEMSA